MPRKKTRNFSPDTKRINLAAIEASLWKHIRQDPFMSAKYHDELMCKNIKEERRKRFKRSPFRKFK